VARDTGSHSEGFLSSVKLWAFGHASGEHDSASENVIQRDDDGGRKQSSASSVELWIYQLLSDGTYEAVALCDVTATTGHVADCEQEIS